MEFLHFAVAPGHFADFALTAGLIFAGLELRHLHKDQKAKITAQQVRNGLEIAKQHREIWWQYLDRPEQLSRIRKPNPDLVTQPVTEIEVFYVTFLIHHLRVCFQARVNKMHVDTDAVEKDIKHFLSLPIPRAVWESSKEFQDREFIRYVDSNL
jgi:hypothetical protein